MENWWDFRLSNNASLPGNENDKKKTLSCKAKHSGDALGMDAKCDANICFGFDSSEGRLHDNKNLTKEAIPDHSSSAAYVAGNVGVMAGTVVLQVNKQRERICLGNIVVMELRRQFEDYWWKRTGLVWNDLYCNQKFFDHEPRYRQELDEMKFIRDNPLKLWNFDILYFALTNTTIREQMNESIRDRLSDLGKLIRSHVRDSVSNVKGSSDDDLYCSFVEAMKSAKLNTNLLEEFRKSKRYNCSGSQFGDQILPVEFSMPAIKKQIVSLPPPPGNTVVYRNDIVMQALQYLKVLRQRFPHSITELHLTGNPGCGKSQVARQCGEALGNEKVFDVIMTLDGKSTAAISQSYQSFALRLGMTEDTLKALRYESNVDIIIALKDFVSCKLMSMYNGRWLIILNNLNDELISLLKNKRCWPSYDSVDEWGSGQVIIASQVESLPVDIRQNGKSFEIPLRAGMSFVEAHALMTQVSRRLGSSQDLERVWEALDKQPLSLANAAVEVRKSHATWKEYADGLPKRLRTGFYSAQISCLRMAVTPSNTMLKATSMSISKMIEDNFVWALTFKFLATCSDSLLPLDLLLDYLLKTIPGCQPGSESCHDRISLTAFLLDSSYFFVEELVWGEQREFLAIRTHCVVNAAFRHICIHQVENLVNDQFSLVAGILTFIQGYVLNVSLRSAVFRNLMVPHFMSIFNQWKVGFKELDLGNKKLFFDTIYVFATVSLSSGHVINAVELINFLLHYLHEVPSETEVKGKLFFLKADGLVQQNKPHEAMESAKSAIECFATQPLSLMKVAAQVCLTDVSILLGKMNDVKTMLEEIISVTHEHSFNQEWHMLYCRALQNMGLVYRYLRLFSESEKFFKEAIRESTNRYEKLYAESYCHLSMLYSGMRELNLAFDAAQKAEALFKNWYSPASFKHSLPLVALSLVYHLKGDTKKAGNLSRQALKNMQEGFGKEHCFCFDALDYLGKVYFEEANYEQALEYHKKAIDSWTKQNNSMHPSLARYLRNAGHALRLMGRYTEAENYHQLAIANMIAVCGDKNPQTIRMKGNLSFLYVHIGKEDEAKMLMHQCVIALKEGCGEGSGLYGSACLQYAWILFCCGKHSEALDMLEEAEMVLSGHASFGKHHHKIGDIYLLRGRIAYVQKEFAVAEHFVVIARKIFLHESCTIEHRVTMADNLLEDVRSAYV